MIRQTVAGTWEVDHYFFDQDGRRRRKLKTFAKHKDAVAYEKEALAAVQNGEFVVPSKVTVKERAADWFEKRFANGNFERATKIERENYVNNYIIPAFGSMAIQNLTVERIETKMVEWNKKVDATTVNRVVRTLTNIMAEAKRYKIIKDNPAAEAKRLKESAEEVTPDKLFSKDELRRVIAAIEPGTRERAIIMTLALTGCRIGELLGTSWSAMDLKLGKFHVRTSAADPDKGKEVIFKKPKNKSSERTVPLSKELVHELKLWKLRCPPSERDLVIASDRGTPVRRRAVYELLQGILQGLKIEKSLSPHSFRHTFASLLLADRRPIPEVSALLGHKNSKITMETYAHFVPGEETSAVQDLSASILVNVSPDVSTTAANVS
jgi:integrase